MLKLTEVELAEMGFRRDYHGHSIQVGEYGGTYVGVDNGRWSVSDADSIFYCYPQTKEDLLTLIRLFTPPKPLPANRCYNCDGTGGDCGVDCKHCKGTGVRDAH